MRTISDYLDAYGAARGLPSDYQIAKDLSLTRQAVSKYRNGHAAPDIDTAWRIADAIGADPSEIIATSEIFRAERAHDDARASLWRRRLQTVSTSLCAAFIGVFLFFASPGPAHAGALHAGTEPPSLYIMLNTINRYRGNANQSPPGTPLSTQAVHHSPLCHRLVSTRPLG